MKLIKTKSYDEMSAVAADIIATQVKEKEDSVLGLATGSSPIGCYEVLVKKYTNKELDFAKVKTVNLDEYVGLDGENEQSYRYFMNDNFFDKINIDKANTYVPNGKAIDQIKECDEYEGKVSDLGGVDLQLLGIGSNGHIAFNEPSDCFTKSVHVTKLAQSTIDDNSRLFEKKEDVPTSAYTMGIGTIMKAKKIVLIAAESKFDIVMTSVNGDVTPKIPASILQFHPDVTIIYVDKA